MTVRGCSQNTFAWTLPPALLWTLHFVFIYGLHSVGCALGWQEHEWLLGWDPIRWTLAVASVLAALALIAWLIVASRAWRRGGQFRHLVGAGVALLSLVAVLWEGMAVPVMRPCI